MVDLVRGTSTEWLYLHPSRESFTHLDVQGAVPERRSPGVCGLGKDNSSSAGSLDTAHLQQTTPHVNTHDLSQHVHRIGYHFPSTVVATACSELGLYLTSAGKAVPFHTLGGLQSHPQAESEVSQITINTEARDAIKDLFPNIPEHDLYQIIKTAFQKVSLSEK